MSLLVLGSNGFLSTHLINQYLEKEEGDILGIDIHEEPVVNSYRFTYINGNILELKNLSALVVKNKVNKVIFTIGLFNTPKLTSLIDINCITLLHVLNELKHLNISYYVISSGSVYGPRQLDELPISEASKLQPNSDYGRSKVMLERICDYYADKYNQKITIIRPSNFIGVNISNKLVVGRIIESINQKISLSEIEISLFNKTSKRDFIPITLFSNLLIKLMKLQTDGMTINISSGIPISIEDFVKKIGLVMNKKITIATEYEEPDPNYSASSQNPGTLLQLLQIQKDEFLKIYDKELTSEIRRIFHSR